MKAERDNAVMLVGIDSTRRELLVCDLEAVTGVLTPIAEELNVQQTPGGAVRVLLPDSAVYGHRSETGGASMANDKWLDDWKGSAVTSRRVA
eukprot:652171-Amphidinium_carterae.1